MPDATSALDAERQRIAESDAVAAGAGPWRAWGPYLAERAWGTVREDYSPGGDAWDSFPHDHARSRVYRWNEDGLAGICDDAQSFCLALALWNGVDPILKERAFGLANGEGNHGEDVKERWWYLDNVPTHSWMRWRYHYPQRAFPYAELVEGNARRGKDDPELEIVDTGAFADDRYWEITVDHAKAAPEDCCTRIAIVNRGPDEATLHVLPQLWFRNTWRFARVPQQVPVLRADGASVRGEHPRVGRLVLAGDGEPTPLACDNETSTRRVFGTAEGPAFPKDGINDHVVAGAATVRPDGTGTKAALWYRLVVPAGGTAVVRLRLAGGEGAEPGRTPDLGEEWERTLAAREREADAFWAGVVPPGTPGERQAIVRQALSGLLWSKQFYHYDVDRWLTGDPGQPSPPAQRMSGRNAGWRHVDNHDVIVMPDAWEYPWYAAWDLAFHAVALAHVDPELAKQQLLLLCREWYMHPNGQLPAYEWNFGDVNPPVQAWAALRVFRLAGGDDHEFLERMFHKLVINFTWWVNRLDAEGDNLFEGGFLGLDNIGPFDRSSLPVQGRLEQSDGTAWMARYCLDLLEMAVTLAVHDPTYGDVAIKFFEHYAYISTATVAQGLWDEEDGFFYDMLRLPGGRTALLRYRSMVGLLPLCAVLALEPAQLAGLPDVADRMRWFVEHKPQFTHGVVRTGGGPGGPLLLAAVAPDQLRRLLARLADEAEFLSPHGLRALSAAHRAEPFVLDIDGYVASVDYEPAESRSGLFGGNSNWRGPVWFPLNYLLLTALRRFDACLGPQFTIPVAGRELTLGELADEVADRLVSLFVPDAAGRPPAAGDDDWPAGQLWFHEYFDGDTGKGIGATHQTGWTALVANLVLGDY
ncbi:MAG: MGH1-like glycoside hydrolase domain-containing protein [Frankiaceae bacterium]